MLTRHSDAVVIGDDNSVTSQRKHEFGRYGESLIQQEGEEDNCGSSSPIIAVTALCLFLLYISYD